MNPSHYLVHRSSIALKHATAENKKFALRWLLPNPPTLTSRSSRSLRSLGHSALRTCSGVASPFSPEQALHAECRLTGR